MLLDFEFNNCSRQCAATGRTFAAGETYFSTLQLERGVAVRRDYAVDAWQGPPEGIVGWWKSRTLEADAARPKLAPQDVLLNLFAELDGRPDDAKFRYVLGLLLLRRRLVKLQTIERDEAGELLVLYSPRRDEQFELRVVAPDKDETEYLQRRMVDLLYGGEQVQAAA